MRPLKLNTLLLLLFTVLISYFSSCSAKKQKRDSMTTGEELNKIDSLLKDEAFTRSMAEHLDAAYYKGLGQAPPPFLSPEEEKAVVSKSVKEEKIATNLAGFYALECGIDFLCNKHKSTPVEILNKVVNRQLDSADNLILNRLANATWKAGQPFRGLERIKRPVFTIASKLPVDEVKKDEVQITSAATRLLASMQFQTTASKEEQIKQLRSLLHDTNYALQVASSQDSAYYNSQQQTPPPFLSKEEETATLKKSVAEQKIATNIAGFYALECGLNYLATTRNVLPSSILQSIVDGSISKEDEELFARFANATWKAGQPFIGLERITRETFTPFYFLREADIAKDVAQIKAAAEKLLKELKPAEK
jgi:hypothetical protein